MIVRLENANSPGVNCPNRLAAGAERLVIVTAQVIQQHLGDDTASRVSGAKNQDVMHNSAVRFSPIHLEIRRQVHRSVHRPNRNG